MSDPPRDYDDANEPTMVEMVEFGRDSRKNDEKILTLLAHLERALRTHIREAETYYAKVDALMIERKIVLGIFIFALGGIGWVLDKAMDYYCKGS